MAIQAEEEKSGLVKVILAEKNLALSIDQKLEILKEKDVYELLLDMQ